MNPRQKRNAILLASVIAAVVVVVVILVLALVLGRKKEEKAKGLYLTTNQFLIENRIAYDFSEQKPFCIDFMFTPEVYSPLGIPLFIYDQETRSRILFLWNWAESFEAEIPSLNKRISAIRGIDSETQTFLQYTKELELGAEIYARMSYDGNLFRLGVGQYGQFRWVEMESPYSLAAQTTPTTIGAAIIDKDGVYEPLMKSPDFEFIVPITCVGEYFYVKMWDVANPTTTTLPIVDYDFTKDPDATTFQSTGTIPDLFLTKKTYTPTISKTT